MKKCIVVVLILSFLSACSSHKPIRQPELIYDLQAQQNKVTNDVVEMMVKPIHLKSELNTYFDDDLIKYGILPVQVSLSNKFEETIHFTTDGVNLIDPSGNRSPLMPAESVVEKAKKSYWRSAGWGVAFGVFGVIPSMINVSNTNQKIKEDYETRILKCGDMVCGATTQGIAFFEVPKEIETLDGWKFAVAYKAPNNEEMQSIESELSGQIESRKLEDNESSDAEDSGESTD